MSLLREAELRLVRIPEPLRVRMYTEFGTGLNAFFSGIFPIKIVGGE